MDEDGYVKIVGRIKDMIIRGGENVYPREIEEFLYTHPGVADVQVIGVPDERYGRGDHGVGPVRAKVRRSRPKKYASSAATGSRTTRCLRYVHFTDEFPMTVTGKKQKFVMRERAIELLNASQ